MTIPSRAAAEKQRLRKELRAARRALDASALAERTRVVRHAAARLACLAEARTVVGYVANDGEIDVDGVLEDCRRRGALIVLPRLRSDGALDLVPSDGGPRALRPTGPAGLLEPAGAASSIEALPRPAVLLTPAVGLAPDGARLGRGGAAYDRLIAAVRAHGWQVIGVSHASAILSNLPTEPHDQAVDALLSERGVRWRIPVDDTPAATLPSAVLLAGGRSRRMGEPKALAMLAGTPLVRHAARALLAACDDLVIVLAPAEASPPDFATQVLAAAVGDDDGARARLRIVHDPEPHLGPVAGLARGFAAVAHPLAFAAGCDTPLLSPALLASLHARAEQTPASDAIVPRWNDRPQPLTALYRVTPVRALFERQIASGALRLTDALARLRCATMTERELRAIDPEGRSFVNLNTPDELARAHELLGGARAVGDDAARR